MWTMALLSVLVSVAADRGPNSGGIADRSAGPLEFHLYAVNDAAVELGEAVTFLLEVRNPGSATCFVPRDFEAYTECGFLEFQDASGRTIEWACSTGEVERDERGCTAVEPDFPLRPVPPRSSAFFWLETETWRITLGVGACTATFVYTYRGGQPRHCPPMSPRGFVYGPVRSNTVQFRTRPAGTP